MGIGDFLDVLAAWGTADPVADFAPNGGDGDVGIDEFLTVLAEWGNCFP